MPPVAKSNLNRPIYPPPTIDPDSQGVTLLEDYSDGIVFTDDGGVGEIKFNASVNWKTSVPEAASKWCSMSPASGPAGQNITVKVTVAPNETYDERNASVSIIGAVVTKKIMIVQKQKDALLLSSSKVEMGIDGGAFEIGVQANVAYDYEIPQQFASWLHAARSRALSGSTVGFEVDENTGSENREGYIDFFSGPLRERVTVYQKGGDFILLSNSEKHISAQGGDFSVELRSNCDFTMSPPSASWLKINQSRTISTHTVYYTAEPYGGEDAPRSAQVEFVSPGGDVRDTLTVIQHEKSALIIGSDRLNVGPAGGAVKIEFATNTDVEAEIISSDRPWVVKTDSRAIEQKEMWFTVSPNAGNEPRTAIIRLSVKGDDNLTAEVTLEQQELGFEIIEQPELPFFTDARACNLTVKAAANAPLTVETTGNITATGSEGNDYFFRLAANLDPENQPISQIRFGFCGIELDRILITQPAARVAVVRSEITVGCEGGAVDLPIETNTNPECAIASGGNWISLRMPDRGVPQVVFEPNGSEDNRYATVSVAIPGLSQPATIQITQQGNRPPGDKTISNNKPGKLLNSLGADALTLTSIRIDGEMNATDLATLSYLAQSGKLRSADLRDVSIIADESTYQTSTGNLRLTENNSLGEKMFFKTKLEFITLPRALKKIGNSAFEFSNLNEITVPDGVTEIGSAAFRGCGRLTRATIPGSVATLSSEIFCECMNLAEVNLGEGIRRIGKLAFGHLNISYNTDDSTPTVSPSLTSLKIPQSVEIIDSVAFQGSGLTSIELPRSLKKMAPKLFYMSFNLRKAVMPAAPADGVLPAQTFYYCHSLEELSLPEGLTAIGEAALANVRVNNLTIPSTVTVIERYGLNMVMCKTLRLPDALTTLREGALSQLPWLERLELPAGLTEIGPLAFYSTFYSLSEIRCHMPSPPALPADAFSPELNRATPLIVPAGSGPAYAADPEWGKFTNIIESNE